MNSRLTQHFGIFSMQMVPPAQPEPASHAMTPELDHIHESTKVLRRPIQAFYCESVTDDNSAHKESSVVTSHDIEQSCKTKPSEALKDNNMSEVNASSCNLGGTTSVDRCDMVFGEPMEITKHTITYSPISIDHNYCEESASKFNSVESNIDNCNMEVEKRSEGLEAADDTTLLYDAPCQPQVVECHSETVEDTEVVSENPAEPSLTAENSPVEQAFSAGDGTATDTADEESELHSQNDDDLEDRLRSDAVDSEPRRFTRSQNLSMASKPETTVNPDVFSEAPGSLSIVVDQYTFHVTERQENTSKVTKKKNRSKVTETESGILAPKMRRINKSDSEIDHVNVGKNLKTFLANHTLLKGVYLNRGKRDIKKQFVTLKRNDSAIDQGSWKRGQFCHARNRLDDMFELTPAGQVRQQQILEGQLRDEYVVNWYLWCPGHGRCLRQCGGIGQCVTGE